MIVVNFFPFPLWIPGENRAKLKKIFNLNNKLRWGAQYHRYTEYTYYFLISNCSNASEDKFNFVSDYRNSFNCKLKKLIKAQITILYSPLNALIYLPYS